MTVALQAVILALALTASMAHDRSRTTGKWTRWATSVKTGREVGPARKWHHRPLWQRAVIQGGTVLLVGETALGLFTLPGVTLAALITAALSAAAWGIAWTCLRLRDHARVIGHVTLKQTIRHLPAVIARWWNHRRGYTTRLRDSLQPVFGVIPWQIKVTPDRSLVTIRPPYTFAGHDHERLAVVSTIGSLMHREGLEPDWTGLHGRKPQIRFHLIEPPPGILYWDNIAARIGGVGDSDLVTGIGHRGKLITASLKSDSPHLGIGMGTGAGKALALDTRLPTPSGWTTMDEIQPGDVVYDETGAPCRVTAATAVMHGRPCYAVEFSDGSVITADAGHQWLAETLASRRTIRTDRPAPQRPRSWPEIVTTETMARALHHGKHRNYSVRTAAPLQSPYADLPVPPYTLGAWLGDGATVTGSITSADAEIISAIEEEGETTWVVPSTIKANHASYRVKGLNVRLRAAGVLGNKHIPDAYLRASEPQRRALLAGLLDTDGSCSSSGRIEFCSTREPLARDVRHLVATLGYKAFIRSKTARLRGKACGTVWTVSFTTADKVFSLPRKASRQVTATRKTSGRRYVTTVRPVPSVPVRCIEVDSPSRLYLASEACIPTHNSNLAAFWLVQRLRRGDFALIVDGKRFSHPWAFKDMAAAYSLLPNVAYVRSISDIHDALVWLGLELAERNKYVEQRINAKGDLLGEAPKRLFGVMEELNYIVPQLKSYWARQRDLLLAIAKETGTEKPPKESPALMALAAVAAAGRAVGIHLIFIGQRLDAEVLGSSGSKGGAVRGNIGVRALARYDEAAWKMQAGGVPMPPSPSVEGRIQLWIGGEVHECQVPWMDHKHAISELRELATGGIVTRCPEGMPGRSQVSVLAREPVLHAPDQPKSVGQAPDPDKVTLAEAHRDYVFGETKLETIQRYSRRDNFPQRVGFRGNEKVYLLADLYAYQAKREKVSA